MGLVRFVNEFTFYLKKAQTRGRKIFAKIERARVVVGIKLRGPPGSAADRFVTTDLENSIFCRLVTLYIPHCFKTDKFWQSSLSDSHLNISRGSATLINKGFGAFAAVGYSTTSFRNFHRDPEARDFFLRIQFITCNSPMWLDISWQITANFSVED